MELRTNGGIAGTAAVRRAAPGSVVAGLVMGGLVMGGLVALVGCSAAPGPVPPSGPGAPAPVAVPTSAASAALPAPGSVPLPAATPNGLPAAPANPGPVPMVARPLDAGSVPARPCAALRATDLPGLDITPTGGSAGGTQCAWTGAGGAAVRVVWESAGVGGLIDVYADRSTMAYFQPTTVAGYPAVYASAFGDRRAAGDCTIYAAVNNNTVFYAEYQAAAANRALACRFAAGVAADVIKNLGGA